MTKRSRTNEQTREMILAKGLDLFNSKGYHGTGLKEILDSAGIPKGSFYHYFDSKEHFAVEIINHYRGLEHDRWEREFKGSDLNRMTQIRQALATIIREYDAQEVKFGCLIANLSGELANSSPYFRRAINSSTEEVLICITDDMALAQREGDIRNDIPARELAELFWDSWQGALLRMKVTRSTAPLHRVVTNLLDDFFKPASPTTRPPQA